MTNRTNPASDEARALYLIDVLKKARYEVDGENETDGTLSATQANPNVMRDNRNEKWMTSTEGGNERLRKALAELEQLPRPMVARLLGWAQTTPAPRVVNGVTLYPVNDRNGKVVWVSVPESE